MSSLMGCTSDVEQSTPVERERVNVGRCACWTRAGGARSTLPSLVASEQRAPIGREGAARDVGRYFLRARDLCNLRPEIDLFEISGL